MAEIYEEEYTGENKNKKEDIIIKELDSLIEELYTTFDSLSNGNFVPRDIYKNNEIKVDVKKAISNEDQGNFVSNNISSINNVKEIFNVNSILKKSKEEMNKNELQNIHNKKKRNIRKRIHQKQNKLKLEHLTNQLGSKFEAKIKLKNDMLKKKQKNSNSDNNFKSNKIFGKLNDIVNQKNVVDNQFNNNSVNAKKFKL